MNPKLYLCSRLVVWPVSLASYQDKGYLSTSSLFNVISDAVAAAEASIQNFAFIAATIYHYHHLMSLINVFV